MDRRTAREEFYQLYGFRGSEDELADFMSEQGYYDDDPYQDYSAFRYRPTKNSWRDSSDTNNANNAGDVSGMGTEFSKLMRELLEEAKKHKKTVSVSESQLMNEFAFMALLFMLKTSVYFILRYCEERGYCSSI